MPIRNVAKGDLIPWPVQGGVAMKRAPSAGLLIYDDNPSGDRKPPVLITNSALAEQGYAPLRSLGPVKRRAKR